MLDYQKVAVEKISEVLQISEDDSFSLLKRHRWCGDLVLDGWFESRNPSIYVTSVSASTINEFLCGICWESCPIQEVAPTLCGHQYCKNCVKEIISVNLRNGPKVLDVVCPKLGCGRTLGFRLVESVACDRDIANFKRFATLSYVDDNPNIKWCTGVNCIYAIALKDQNCADVECPKLHRFCWMCLGEAHYPVDCTVAEKWQRKTHPEQTIKCTTTDVKICPNPKCKKLIDLYTGCPHVTCVCNHEFCWTCLRPWILTWEFTHEDMTCEPKRVSVSSEEKEKIPQAPSEADEYYRRLFSLRENELDVAINLNISNNYYVGHSMAVKLAWFEIRRCKSISKWICALAHQCQLDVIHFWKIKEEAEVELQRLISYASQATDPLEINDCTKKARGLYDRMVARMQWEASWKETSF